MFHSLDHNSWKQNITQTVITFLELYVFCLLMCIAHMFTLLTVFLRWKSKEIIKCDLCYFSKWGNVGKNILQYVNFHFLSSLKKMHTFIHVLYTILFLKTLKLKFMYVFIFNLNIQTFSSYIWLLYTQFWNKKPIILLNISTFIDLYQNIYLKFLMIRWNYVCIFISVSKYCV